MVESDDVRTHFYGDGCPGHGEMCPCCQYSRKHDDGLCLWCKIAGCKDMKCECERKLHV